VRRVVLRYQLERGRRAHRAAALLRVTSGAGLTAAGIRRPFGYFIGSVPTRARRISAEAHDGAGKVLGRFAFDPIVRSMHPTVFISSEQ